MVPNVLGCSRPETDREFGTEDGGRGSEGGTTGGTTRSPCCSSRTRVYET